MKKVLGKMKEQGTSEEDVKTFQTGAQSAVKKILANIDNFDVFVGPGEEAVDGMYILVDYREDGITPYATIWKNGLSEMKV